MILKRQERRGKTDYIPEVDNPAKMGQVLPKIFFV
jgi:hypothetical protein